MNEPIMEVEQILLYQTELLENLKRSYSNFKKTPKDRIKLPYLETQLELLEHKWTDFRQGHKSLISEKTKHLPYFTEGVYNQAEDLYVTFKSLCKEVIEKLKPVVLTESAATTSTSAYKHEEQTEGNAGDVKLPRLQLPQFSGKYEEWQQFHDLFVCTIHNNKTLSAVQKLKYLKGQLLGEAQQLLNNFAITEANYEECWRLLISRYDNKRYNSNAVFKTFLAQKKVSTESAQAIKTLVDTTSSCLQSLRNMGISTENWDPFVVHFVVSKLDVESVKLWEQKFSSTDEKLPTWPQLKEFLETRFRCLELIDAGASRAGASGGATPTQKAKAFHAATVDNNSSYKTCAMCGEQHLMFQCKKFADLNVVDRQNFVQQSKLCFNCLAPTHSVAKCYRPLSCHKCGRRHHTLLHFDRKPPQNDAGANYETNEKNEVSPSQVGGNVNVVSNFARENIQPSRVLLATAVIQTYSKNGCKQMIRTLLDQGSQASFVTEATVQLLGLARIPVSGLVSGLGEGHTKIKYMVSFKVESRYNPSATIHVNAYVLKSLTSDLPTTELTTEMEWVSVQGLQLADPSYTTPGRIDLLLGAEVYGEIILEGILKHPQECLIAQNSIFGWIISGKMSTKATSDRGELVSLHVRANDDELLRQFWEIESEPNSIKTRMTANEKKCEQYFDETTTRDNDGRYVVRILFDKEDPQCQYGNLREIAKKRLRYLENKLSKNEKLKDDYTKVLDEYVTLDHMTLVDEEEVKDPTAVYLPHHAVVKEERETTKVRVVFDASCKGTNNVSLNDELLVGPKLQQDLRHILMRWRVHGIAIVADIVKMYRMVKVADIDTKYQRILWRGGPEDQLQHFKMLRLTFGTASAPYLAVKVLQRLADDEKEKFPIAAELTKKDFMMDDLLSGCETVTEGKVIYEQMNELMKAGGFELQKWNSNNPELLEYINTDKRDKGETTQIKLNSLIKVLGISWNKEKDEFQYTLNQSAETHPVTKRMVLSDVARLYDPIGWLAPVIVVAKMFIQKLWKSGLDWDDDLTTELEEEWFEFRRSLTGIQMVRIPRWLNITKETKIELHTFSDASKAAYAAAVYARVVHEEQVTVSLVTAKTKVAPIEREQTVPRLELCGAALASKLAYEVAEVMEIPKENMFAWTDSTIVLAWLKGGSSKWTTFVSNRVSEILNIFDFEQWGHVTTDKNPADCASRGLHPGEIADHTLWLKGPDWLAQPTIPTKELYVEDVHDEERVKSLNTTVATQGEFVWEKFSSLQRMLKVMSYCRRFLRQNRLNKGMVTPNEMHDTLQACIKQVQELRFAEEIDKIKRGCDVAKKSPLRNLDPFVDQNGILRVGGRINQSDVSYDTRHPILLPDRNQLTTMVILDAHNKTLHGGPQVMLQFLRSKYWILRAKEQVKKEYRACVKCRRYATNINSTPFMGQIPEIRLKPSRAFKSAGTDYAGPVNLKFSPGRGAKSYKGYICLFICMVTRAIHLEAVSDLTSKGFIAAFRRFTARRGHCSDLYSDNGTNFVGANKELNEMFQNAKSAVSGEIAEQLALVSTTWHFIPPHAANFGGIWEAGVRSTKTHLRKVIGDTILTFEELTTVLTQVEACLNSRPLSVLSDDPRDPLPLTPGHFLVGEPLLNIADEDYTNCKIAGLDRWRLTQKIVTDFWNRWNKEYLVNLNNRYKWNTKKTEPEIDDIVILKDDYLPPAKWLLGRIILKHTGPDMITYVELLQSVAKMEFSNA